MNNIHTPLRSGPLLGISLDQDTYIPGDIITGHVYRQFHTISPDASLSICTFGRGRTIGVIGNNSQEYRGVFDLCYHPKIIFQGPLHIESSKHKHKWPFNVTLPKYVNTYTPLGPISHRMPPSYMLRKTKNMAAVIEYVIKARLTMTVQGQTEVLEATFPFKVINMTPDSPIADFRVEQHRHQCIVSSHRLIPGMQDVKVSWKDKIKQSLHGSKNPTLAFDLFVEVPKVVQLDNPTPIPFRLLVSPNWEETSDTIQDVAQDVKLVSVHVCIITITTIICHAGLQVTESTEVDLGLSQTIKLRGEAIRIPFTADCQPIDIGEMINLRIGLQVTRFPQQWISVQSEFTHSFQIYNIRVSHQLKWSVQGEIAGERFKATGTSDLLVLKPSDGREYSERETNSQDVVLEAGERIPLRQGSSWIRPPAEEQLPSFADAQREGSRVGMSRS
ncbi:Arrestin-like, C-terminal [Fusarium oxysporum f. sp. vasinfectum]|uniref:Arrestin-like N-terminal domain-containing protein n=1 Tax=Fusarium oxysporum f. sp. vasinfectum 25433 TaxID=1089449 RepID=X0LY54_FUSOX|nr:hypothetical protein FOTG_07187 [Fusarium oxysporum f. sp. vasinfectum 25433]KAK2672635.1 Arrestin-like, C-terminal [Fusarium oxysporum f. sp. vasinfectum]KAK2928098.1 Arrestin-like, C-terminal [Fusarium oxysporum f. sp. vasinfectum]